MARVDINSLVRGQIEEAPAGAKTKSRKTKKTGVEVDVETVRIDEVLRSEWNIKIAEAKAGSETVTGYINTPDPKKDGFKKAKLAKKKASRKGIIEVKTETIIVGHKPVKVAVRVLHDGNEYFVGKTPPSGRAPWGTTDKGDKAEQKAWRKLRGYIDRRADSAWQAESQGGRRNGGSHEDYAAASEAINLVTE